VRRFHSIGAASPRQSLFKSHALPQRVYFDASVLLPAIVPGHPFNKLYRETVDRLIKAASQAGVGLPALRWSTVLERGYVAS